MKRIANLSIIVEDSNDDNITRINAVLHEYSEHILGRLGIPDKLHNVNIISVALCASLDILNSLTGKLGKIYGVSAKDIADRIEKLGTEVHYLGSFDACEKFLEKNLINNDLLITMGAGDVYLVGENLLNK